MGYFGESRTTTLGMRSEKYFEITRNQDSNTVSIRVENNVQAQKRHLGVLGHCIGLRQWWLTWSGMRNHLLAPVDFRIKDVT